jgi:glutathione S-transferase
MPKLELIGAPASNYVWVCRIALTEKGVPYDLISAMPHTAEVDTIHPFGKIPVMRHGAVTLAESRAICFYVDRTFDGPALVPADTGAAAEVEQWVSIVNTHIDPVWVRQYLGAYFFPRTVDGSPDRAVIDAALLKMEQQFGVMDRAVAATGHLVGDAFTLADINLLPILFYMQKCPESAAMLDTHANLKAYFERHFSRPSVQVSVPQSLPGRTGAQTDAARAA